MRPCPFWAALRKRWQLMVEPRAWGDAHRFAHLLGRVIGFFVDVGKHDESPKVTAKSYLLLHSGDLFGPRTLCPSRPMVGRVAQSFGHADCRACQGVMPASTPASMSRDSAMS